MRVRTIFGGGGPRLIAAQLHLAADVELIPGLVVDPYWELVSRIELGRTVHRTARGRQSVAPAPHAGRNRIFCLPSDRNPSVLTA